MPYIATIDILVDVDTETKAMDTIANVMQAQLRINSPSSCFVDWCWSEEYEAWRNLFPTEPLPPDFRPDNPWPEIIM